jgi:hypothetical protein
MPAYQEEPPTPTPTEEVTTEVVFDVPWEVDCDDDDDYNGYWDRGVCVPGVITREAWFAPTRGVVVGTLSSYPEGLMEKVASNRKMSLSGYIDGMSAISCGDLGKVGWIALPPDYAEWIGPFLVVDCSHQHHMFVTTVVHNYIGEIGYKTAEKLGFRGMSYVAVRYGGKGFGTWDDWTMYGPSWEMFDLEFIWKPSMGGVVEVTPTPTIVPTPTATEVVVAPKATLVYSDEVIGKEPEPEDNKEAEMGEVEFTNLAAVLLWIATAGGAPYLAGKAWAFLLENWTWFHSWNKFFKFMVPMVLSILFAFAASAALQYGGGVLEQVQPWYAVLAAAVIGWLGSQKGYVEAKAAEYGADPALSAPTGEG